MKYLSARILIFPLKYFDEPIDGLIYSSAIAIGFASIESLIYVPLLTWPYQLARSLVGPLTHSLFSSVWGFGTAYAVFHLSRSRYRALFQFLCLVGAIVMHGLYDFLLLSANATFLASGVALILWAFLIAYARRLVRKREVAA